MPIHWPQRRALPDRSRTRIVPLKLNDRVRGSSAAFAIFLNVRGVNDL
jgi:hypothetical protein